MKFSTDSSDLGNIRRIEMCDGGEGDEPKEERKVEIERMPACCSPTYPTLPTSSVYKSPN